MFPYHFELSPTIGQVDGNSLKVPKLSGVQFHGGSVSLTYSKVPLLYNDQILTEMIFKLGAVPYKKIKFNSTKHIGESDIYYLDDLFFYGEDQSVVKEKCSFLYYESEYPNQVEPLEISAEHKDLWGYYSRSVSELLPHQKLYISPNNMVVEGPVFQEVNPHSFRDANEHDKKIGMLKKITYPTGGQTEFIYEGNRYDYAPNYIPNQNPATLEGPGLRIKEVISKPGNGKNIHKIYKYGKYEDGRGFINEHLRPDSRSLLELMATESNVMHFWEWIRMVDSDQNIPWPMPEQAGYRNRVYFSDPYINFDLHGSQIKYDAVSEFLIEDNFPKQKTQSRYSWRNNEQVIDFIVNDRDEQILHNRKYSDPQNAWLTPVLDSKAYYKYSDGQPYLIKNESFNYWTLEKDEAWDMPTYLHTRVVYARSYSPANSTYELSKQYNDINCSIYGYGFRNYKTGTQVLVSTIVEEFTPNGWIKTEKHNEYEPEYHLLKSEEIVNSKNETVKNTYFYPHELTSIPVYQQMKEQNVLSPVIEHIAQVNGVQTKKMTTNYFSPFFKVFVPQSVAVKNGSNPQNVVATFNKYDNMGHVLEQQKANDIKEVYLWGYDSTYPVAKIINTTYDIAKTYITQSVLDNPADETILRSHLNNLRNIPGAMVTTYTYKPLVGMTSQTDANNRTTYYDYDDYGRLQFIRDQDNNIIKKYCYSYSGQAQSCP